VYSDTKIRLHFSHFKILEPSRETCFLDTPHQCADIKAKNSYASVDKTVSDEFNVASARNDL